MRKLFVAAAAAVLGGVLALPAVAGDCLSGFDCDHVCPLAREANNHRSAGAEAVTRAPSLRAALFASLERNLRRI